MGKCSESHHGCAASLFMAKDRTVLWPFARNPLQSQHRPSACVIGSPGIVGHFRRGRGGSQIGQDPPPSKDSLGARMVRRVKSYLSSLGRPGLTLVLLGQNTPCFLFGGVISHIWRQMSAAHRLIFPSIMSQGRKGVYLSTNYPEIRRHISLSIHHYQLRRQSTTSSPHKRPSPP
jgi:hypothetical protein